MSQCTFSFVPRRGFMLALIALSGLITVGLVILDSTSDRISREEGMEETVAILRTRVKFLESQYRGKQQDVIGIQERVDGACNTSQPVTGNKRTNNTLSLELAALLKNISGSKASDAVLSSSKPERINVPFSMRIMPHLMDHPDSLRPAYQLGSPRQYSDYIIGVPHVKRDKEMYLFDTLKGLLDKMKDEDKNVTMITVMIGETNLTYVVETAHKIETTFPKAVKAGLIEVISPSKHYYPNLDELPQNLGDSLKRVKWRSKQNLDAIFLMGFVQSRCMYYMMVEDDVVTLDNYMTEIRQFTTASTVKSPDWFFIQYSTTGGIGKLFRTSDLISFMTYVQIFYNHMPIDWLTESFLADRVCGINKSAQECKDAKNKIRPTYKKNLFKHVGAYSSLKGKMQKVKYIDRILGRVGNSTVNPGWWKWAMEDQKNRKDVPVTKQADFFPHANPPVTYIKCDLDHVEKHTIDNAYEGRAFFWAKNPKKGNVIEFWFAKPGKFNKYLIRSGNLQHVNDIIIRAVFEVLPVANKKNSTFVQIDRFDEFGMVEGYIDSEKYGELLAMRIRFEANGKYWVAITEIEFVYQEEPPESNKTI